MWFLWYNNTVRAVISGRKASNSKFKPTHSQKAKNDEFYTQLVDIEKELRHYKAQLKDKVIFCNCDDPFESNFFKNFAMNFNHLGLKKLIATCYTPSPIAGTQLALLDIVPPLKKGMDKNSKQAYKIEINEIQDEDGDGAVGLSDGKTDSSSG